MARHIHDFIHPLSTDWSATGGKGHRGAAAAAAAARREDRALSSAEITVCGALSKLVASIATYPSQVVRSRLQQRMDSRMLKYSGVGDVLRTTLAREGVRGLYKGLLPNVLRVMPQSALTFLVYEGVMQQLSAASKAKEAAAAQQGR